MIDEKDVAVGEEAVSESPVNGSDPPEREKKKVSKSTKFFFWLKRFFTNPANIILIVYFAVLAFFIFYPLITLVYDTFVVTSITETRYGVKLNSATGLWWYRMLASEYSAM